MKNNQIKITSACLHDTQEIGNFLGTSSEPGFNYLLNGNLGSGKTCLTQGILKGLGYNGYVHSPTFVLMTEYDCEITVYHIDLYRLSNQDQIDDLMLDEQLESGENVNIIEWADKSEYLNNITHIKVDLKFTKPNERILIISSDFAMYENLISSIRNLDLKCRGTCE